MLRYRTGDISALDRSPCACGRTQVRMARIRGRSDDMLIIRGVNLYPSEVERVLLNVGDVAPHYQLVLDRPAAMDELTVVCEPASDAADVEALRARVSRAIHDALGLDRQRADPGTRRRPAQRGQGGAGDRSAPDVSERCKRLRTRARRVAARHGWRSRRRRRFRRRRARRAAASSCVVEEADATQVAGEARAADPCGARRRLRRRAQVADLAGVLAQARHARLDQGRAAARAGAVDGLAHDPVHLQRVGAVDADAHHA